jgi:hypothetical protein
VTSAPELNEVTVIVAKTIGVHRRLRRRLLLGR